jgi:hypothetical protein
MLKMTSRLAALAVAALAVSALAGCGETNAPPQASVPPPPPAQEAPPPELLGGPPPRDFTPMAPIPNPEDMTPAERARVYGAHYYGQRRQRLAAWRAAHHPRVHAVLNTQGGHPVSTVIAAPILPAVKVAAPVAVVTPAPPPAVKPVATPTLTPVQKLQAAVGGVGRTAVLAVPSDLSAAKPGKVTLSLPANLFSVIRAEAAKLGLVKAARKTEVTATLSGDGYIITPNGPQTAPLKAGKATTFTWQVLPGAGAKGALKADVSAMLKGAGAAESFSVAHLEQTIAAVEAAAAAEAAKTAASHGMGKMKSSPLFWGAIALLVLVVLGIFGRIGANRREADERRRRFRTMSASDSGADEDVRPAAPVVTAAPPVETPAPEPVAHAEPVAETPVEAPVETAQAETAAVEPETAAPAETAEHHKAEDLETV